MASRIEIFELLIQPLVRVLGEPSRPGQEPEAVFDAICDELESADPLWLSAALPTLRKSPGGWFPNLADISAAVYANAPRITPQSASALQREQLPPRDPRIAQMLEELARSMGRHSGSQGSP